MDHVMSYHYYYYYHTTRKGVTHLAMLVFIRSYPLLQRLCHSWWALAGRGWFVQWKILGNSIHKGCRETALVATTLSKQPLVIHLAQDADPVSSLPSESSSVYTCMWQTTLQYSWYHALAHTHTHTHHTHTDTKHTHTHTDTKHPHTHTNRNAHTYTHTLIQNTHTHTHMNTLPTHHIHTPTHTHISHANTHLPVCAPISLPSPT